MAKTKNPLDGYKPLSGRQLRDLVGRTIAEWLSGYPRINARGETETEPACFVTVHSCVLASNMGDCIAVWHPFQRCDVFIYADELLQDWRLVDGDNYTVLGTPSN